MQKGFSVVMKQFKIKTSEDNRLNRNRDVVENLSHTDDLKTEEMLQTSPKTPLGQLLAKIAQLPEVRYEKITAVRRQINMGQYEIDEKLDAAIDKMLEELLVEP